MRRKEAEWLLHAGIIHKTSGDEDRGSEKEEEHSRKSIPRGRRVVEMRWEDCGSWSSSKCGSSGLGVK